MYMCKVSVILPTYNRAKIIQKSIESVLNQTVKDIELIIVDDGSNDNTKEVISEIKDSRIKYILLEKNGGVSNARNIGMQNATGEWIAFEDSDDIWHPEKLQKQLEYAKDHTKCEVIYCAYSITVSGVNYVVPSRNYKRNLKGYIYKDLLLKNTIGAPTLMFKRKILNENIRFCSELKSLEDWDFALLISKNREVGFVSEVLVNAGTTGGGVSSNRTNYYVAKCKILVRHYKDILELGLFDEYIDMLFSEAKKDKVFIQVQKLLMLHLELMVEEDN